MAWVVTQGAGATPTQVTLGGASATTTLNITPTAIGSMLFATITHSSTSAAPTWTVSDSVDGAWTVVQVASGAGSGATSAAIAYRDNASSTAARTVTLTRSATGVSDFISWALGEATHAGITFATDGTASVGSGGTTTGATCTVSGPTPTLPNGFVLAAGSIWGGTAWTHPDSGDSGWSALQTLWALTGAGAGSDGNTVDQVNPNNSALSTVFTQTGGTATSFPTGLVVCFMGPAGTIDATPASWSWSGSPATVTFEPATAFQTNAFQPNAFQIFGAAAGGGPTTISVTPGTWSWAGSSSTVAVQQINQTPGTWSWAGSTSATTQLVNSTPGTWAWAGSSSATTQLINQTTGTWTWAGSTASTSQLLNATSGTWTWAGSTAGTTQLINAAVGTWSWAGSTQQITTPGGVTTVDAATGAWTWAGSTQTIDVQQIAATVGAFTWAGATASVNGQSVDATPGLWTWAGSQAAIISVITIDMAPGLWTWAGSQASISGQAGGNEIRAGVWSPSGNTIMGLGGI